MPSGVRPRNQITTLNLRPHDTNVASAVPQGVTVNARQIVASPQPYSNANSDMAFIVQQSLRASAKRFSCLKYRLGPQD